METSARDSRRASASSSIEGRDLVLEREFWAEESVEDSEERGSGYKVGLSTVSGMVSGLWRGMEDALVVVAERERVGGRDVVVAARARPCGCGPEEVDGEVELGFAGSPELGGVVTLDEFEAEVE